MNTVRAVDFVHMKDGTRAEYAFLREIEIDYLRRLPDRLIAALNRLGHDDALSGYQVTRLQHCLQTATRAENDGADTEMVMAALLHDIGDELATFNHAELAASILRPYVRPEVTWVVEMHGLFQKQYYAQHYDMDPSGHLALRAHPWFDACQRFCERWDQAAFDPAYPTRPLGHFEPMLREVFGKLPSRADTFSIEPQETALSKVAIQAPKLGAAVGPFSPAVASDGLVFLSGQVGVDPATKQLVGGGVAAQTAQAFVNLGVVLEAAGKTFADVVRVGVYLTDIANFAVMNEVYAQHFEQPYPARTTIAVAALPLGASVEIDLIAR